MGPRIPRLKTHHLLLSFFLAFHRLDPDRPPFQKNQPSSTPQLTLPMTPAEDSKTTPKKLSSCDMSMSSESCLTSTCCTITWRKGSWVSSERSRNSPGIDCRTNLIGGSGTNGSKIPMETKTQRKRKRPTSWDPRWISPLCRDRTSLG